MPLSDEGEWLGPSVTLIAKGIPVPARIDTDTNIALAVVDGTYVLRAMARALDRARP